MAKQEKEAEELLQKIGERIKEIRIAKGYSSYEYFAYENQIPRSQYWRHEKGKDMKLTSLIKILKGFDMTFEEFFKDFSDNAK